jgi:SAM-dependent methyltransferase
LIISLITISRGSFNDGKLLAECVARPLTVVTMNAMHHFPNPDRALSEMVRVLKLVGKLVICDFSPEGFRLMDQIQRAEGKTHPHPARRFPHWQAGLRELGFRTRTWCGCHQEVLVAQSDGSDAAAPETAFVL